VEDPLRYLRQSAGKSGGTAQDRGCGHCQLGAGGAFPLTVTDLQIASLRQLCGEIEGIDRAAREPASEDAVPQDSGVSYSFGLFSGFPLISDAEQTVAEIVASVQATLAKLAPVASLETSRDGFTVRTAIQYRGRVASVLCNPSSPDSYASVSTLTREHLDAVEKTYALRAAFAAAIAAVGGALVSISMAVTNPLTVLQALGSARALKRALERLAAAVEAAG
jgi:hypothetical protein